MNPELRITRRILFSPLGKVGENRRCVKRGGLSVLLPSATTKSSKPAPRHSPPGALVQFLPCAEVGCPFSLVRESLLWSRGTEPEPTLFASFGHTPKGAKTLLYGSSTPLHSTKTMNCAPKIQSFSSSFAVSLLVAVGFGLPLDRPRVQSLTRVRANPSIRGWVSAVVAAPLPYNAHDRKT